MVRHLPIQEFLEEGCSNSNRTFRVTEHLLEMWIAGLIFITVSVGWLAFPKKVVASDIPGVDAPRQESTYYKRRNPQNEILDNQKIIEEPVGREIGDNAGKAKDSFDAKAQKIKKVCEWQRRQGRPLGTYCNTLSKVQEGANRTIQESSPRYNTEPDVWANDQMEKLFMKGGKDPWADEMFLSPEEKQQRAEEKRLIQEEHAEDLAYKRRMRELAIQEKKEQMEMQKDEARQRQIDAEAQRVQQEEQLDLQREQLELERQQQNTQQMLDTFDRVNSFNKSLYPGIR